MLACQVLFLAATISSAANIALGDILVQPGYEHRHLSEQHHLLDHQPVAQHNRVPSPAEQHYARQLITQQHPIMQHHAGGVYVYPYYGMYRNSVPNLTFPTYHQLHHPTYLLKPGSHLHYTKDHHARAPMFIGDVHYLPTVHHQYRRSCKSDPTGTSEFSESANTNYENDVATEPSLIDVKHSTVNDSLLPERDEPTDTDEKRVESRKIVDKNDHAATRSFLFGLNPERMYPRYRQDESPDATRQSLAESVRATPNDMPRTLDLEQSATTFARSIEPTQISFATTAQENEAKQGTLSCVKQEDRSTHNAIFPKDLEDTLVPIRTWSDEESSDDEEPSSAKSCKDSIIIEIPCINLCNQSRVSFVVDLDEFADARETGSDISAGDTGDDETTLSPSNEIIVSPNLDAISIPYATRTFQRSSNNDVAPWFAGYYDYDYHESYDYPMRSILDYVIHRNSHIRGSLASTMDDTTTLLDVSRNPPDNYPTKTRYVPLPEVCRYCHVTTPGVIYTRLPRYPTFSFFPAYY